MKKNMLFVISIVSLGILVVQSTTPTSVKAELNTCTDTNMYNYFYCPVCSYTTVAPYLLYKHYGKHPCTDCTEDCTRMVYNQIWYYLYVNAGNTKEAKTKDYIYLAKVFSSFS